MPKIITKVDSNIRRYRARFCKRLADGKLTHYLLSWAISIYIEYGND